MHKKLITITLLTLAIFAGVFSCPSGLAQEVRPWDVVATITYGNDSYYYQMSRCGDANASTYLGGKAKLKLYHQLLSQGLEKHVVENYIMPGFSNIIDHFAYVNVDKVDSTVVVKKGKLTYTDSTNGVAINVDKLVALLLSSNDTHKHIELPTIVSLAVQPKQLKAITVHKSSFTTYFNKDNANRVHNIKLAANTLDGTVVEPGQTFSFNTTVGCRTVAQGYKVAKVISQGNYVDGVGGGVCQVSTTLYNALLLAGFVPKASSHSLVPSYVLPSFDAMVADNVADLTFENTTSKPVYICATVEDNYVSFSIYGVANRYRVERTCEQTRTPFDTIESNAPSGENCQAKVVQNGSDGVVATAYLNYYLGEVLVKTVKLRTVTYKKVDKVVTYE